MLRTPFFSFLSFPKFVSPSVEVIGLRRVSKGGMCCVSTCSLCRFFPRFRGHHKGVEPPAGRLNLFALRAFSPFNIIAEFCFHVSSVRRRAFSLPSKSCCSIIAGVASLFPDRTGPRSPRPPTPLFVVGEQLLSVKGLSYAVTL